MDDRRFDEMARLMARGKTRRAAVGAALGGALAVALGALGGAEAEAGARALSPQRCVPNGRRCGKGGPRVRSCGKCCSGRSVPDTGGKTRCACRPEGLSCDGPWQCCTGICNAGLCSLADPA